MHVLAAAAAGSAPAGDDHDGDDDDGCVGSGGVDFSPRGNPI